MHRPVVGLTTATDVGGAGVVAAPVKRLGRLHIGMAKRCDLVERRRFCK